jgi:hypothetical protein
LRKLFVFLLAAAFVAVALGAVSGPALAKVTGLDDIRAPYDADVTLTYFDSNPMDRASMLGFIQENVNLTVGAPYNYDLGSVDYDSINCIAYNTPFYLGTIGEGNELLVNVSYNHPQYTSVHSQLGRPMAFNYSTNWSLNEGMYDPFITAYEVNDQVTNYTVWFGSDISDLDTPGEGEISGMPEYYYFMMNVTMTRLHGYNLTEVREYYTYIYPKIFDGVCNKIPCIALTDNTGKVVKVTIENSFDPSTIGYTKDEVNSWVWSVYGVQPTYV